jgi:Protein of unknown function (DUF3768)
MDTQSIEYRARVRALNDQFRRNGIGIGSFMHTDGVHEKGQAFVQGVFGAVRDFDAFSKDNDPYGEHDFGAFDYQGERLFFKIDYYDLALQAHSPDPADPAVTHRVLTIMFASEY